MKRNGIQKIQSRAGNTSPLTIIGQVPKCFTIFFISDKGFRLPLATRLHYIGSYSVDNKLMTVTWSKKTLEPILCNYHGTFP